VSIGIGEQLVVIELEDEGNLVRKLACYLTEDTVGGGHGIAAALDS